MGMHAVPMCDCPQVAEAALTRTLTPSCSLTALFTDGCAPLATDLSLQAVEAALTRILTPKRSIDVLREVKAAQVGK